MDGKNYSMLWTNNPLHLSKDKVNKVGELPSDLTLRSYKSEKDNQMTIDLRFGEG